MFTDNRGKVLYVTKDEVKELYEAVCQHEKEAEAKASEEKIMEEMKAKARRDADAAIKSAPKDTTHEFGAAITMVKQGCRMSRKGWNGKGQYIELATRISYVSPNGETVNATHMDIGSAAIAFVGNRGVQLGWLASQSDMLADDWYIVE